MSISISLHLGLLGEPVISHFNVFSYNRNLILNVACHVQGTLSDLLSLHTFRSLLPSGTDIVHCRFFQSDESGSSDLGICIDLQTVLTDMNGYWFVCSHSFDEQNQYCSGAPLPSAPPDTEFDSGPVEQLQYGGANGGNAASEGAHSYAGPSAPPVSEHYDLNDAPQPPPPSSFSVAPGAPSPPPPLSSEALLNHQVQSSIRCPITLEPFVDPVIASDGHTYERSAIMQLFSMDRSFRISPLTRAPFTNFNLIPNYSMRSLVRDAGYVPDRAEVESGDFSMGSFHNYVDLAANEMEEPLLARDRARNNAPRGQGLAHQIDTAPFPIRLQEKTSSICCNYALFILIFCILACSFNDTLTSQLRSLTFFQVWQDKFYPDQLPVCFYLCTAICSGAFCAVVLSCPSYYFPGFCCANERFRKGLVLLVALLFPLGAIANFGIPVPIFFSTNVLMVSALAYFFWNVSISVVFAIMILSWGRSALYAWNIAPPEGLDAETPVFPFTSTKARVLTALVLSLIFGLFIVLFSLSLELGQLLSLSVASMSIFVFIVILYCHSIRTYRMCKDLVVSQPWFLHSLTVVVAMLSFEVIWLCQSLLVYKLPVDTMFQSFIPLGSFSDEASQRLWFSSGLGVTDVIFVTSGISVLSKMHRCGYRADLVTIARKFYGKWWLALFATILAMPFIVASSIMPLCLQTDMLGLLPDYVSLVVVVTKVVQCCVPAIVWVFAPSCRFQHSAHRDT